jgi:hypothetical protein
MTIPPIAYPALTRTDKYANPVDESGKKSGVPQSHVGIGDVGRCFFRCTGSGRFHPPSLELPEPPRHTGDVSAYSREALFATTSATGGAFGVSEGIVRLGGTIRKNACILLP